MKKLYLILIFLFSACKCYPQLYVGKGSTVSIKMLNEYFCIYFYSEGCLIHGEYNCNVIRENDSVIILRSNSPVNADYFFDRWKWKSNTLTSLDEKHHIILHPKPPRCDTSKVYETADVMPEYPGGEQEIGKFIIQHFKYKYQDGGETQMTFMTEFIVDRTGKVINVRMLNRLTNPGKEMLRVINSMPSWKPGSCEGTNVAVRMFMPIRF